MLPLKICFCLLPAILPVIVNGEQHVTGHHEMLSGDELVPVAHEHQHHHGIPILDTELTAAERLYWSSYNTSTFFNTAGTQGKAFLGLHVTSAVASTLFTYPISLILNDVKSNWYLLSLAIHNFVVILGVVSVSMFANTLKDDLYPGNIYPITNVLLLILSALHFSSAIITRAIQQPNSTRICTGYGSNYFVSLAKVEQDVANEVVNERRNSEGASTDYECNSRTNHLFDSTNVNNVHTFRIQKTSVLGRWRDRIINGLLSKSFIQVIAMGSGSFFEALFHALNIPMYLFLWVHTCIGLAIGNLLGQGTSIFGLLAHWIKGGVFIFLGMVSLGRYCGLGERYGWAWNKSVYLDGDVDKCSLWFKITPKGTITMEFIESFLILFYGSTNVFLEHLANPGGQWTAKDLQHVSIAFMYIGCGLCGLITEYKSNEWRYNQSKRDNNETTDEHIVVIGSPGFSPNPFPAFTIFWTGILMSQHAQASETSTIIHTQWGYLLSYGSFFRLLTFLLFLFAPNNSLKPSRPFSELIVSFCLLAGGLIFMESTDQVVEAIEYRGFTSMFTFNISIGMIALFMAWEMLLFSLRDYLYAKVQNPRFLVAAA